MRKVIYIFLIAVLLLLSLPLGSVNADSYTLYEYYNLNDDGDSELYLALYFGQTFTVGNSSHTINAIRLKIYREGTTPGNLYLSIRDVDGDGRPTGLDLSTGAFEGAALTVTSPGLWYEIPMSEYTLEANTTYAIVGFSTGTTAALNIHWRKDGTASAYADGKAVQSTNGGITWTDIANTDFMFEVYGTPIEPTVEIDDIRIFSSFNNDADWLVAVRYNLIDISNEYRDPAEIWYLQLLNDDDDVVAQQPIRMWGTRPGSIYLNTALAESLEWGSSRYRVQLHSTADDSYDVVYNLSASNWFGSTLTQLDSWCIYTAKLMEDTDSITYTTATLDGTLLNYEGGGLFAIGLPGLDTIRQSTLYYISVSDIADWNDGSDFTQSYGDDLSNYEAALGTRLTGIIDVASSVTHLSGRWIGGITMFAVFVFFAGLGVAKGHAGGGLLVGAIVLIIGLYIGLIPMQLLFVLVGFGIVAFVIAIVWNRGAS